MEWLKKIFRKKVEKIEHASFKEWYLEYRNEMAKAFNSDYAICIASWTFMENHAKYYLAGFSPKEAVIEYMSDKNKNQRQITERL